MFDGAPEQFHQFVAPRTTLPLHLSFALHASAATPNSFLPFDPYNPSHQLPLQTNHLLHHPLPHHQSPTHKDEEKEPSSTFSSINVETERDSWTNDEVLALLRIRSSMENWFPGLTWEHVSRKLAELGFKKSAEKCKEKFEDEKRYFNNNMNYGKNNYRFVSELEELYQNPDPGDGVVAEKTQQLENSRDNDIDAPVAKQCDGNDKVIMEKCSKERKRKRRDRFEMFKRFCESVVNQMMAQQEEIHNKLLRDMLKRDEETLAREEAWKKQEMERMNKELDMMAQEQAIAGDRQATIIEFLKRYAAASQNFQGGNGNNKSKDSNRRSTTTTTSSSPLLHSQNPNPSTEENNLEPSPSSNVILDHQTPVKLGTLAEDVENPSSSDTLLQVPSSSNSSPATYNNNNPLESNSVSTTSTPVATTTDVGRRWPRDEVLALINLRCTSLNYGNNNEEKEGNKGHLWERISQGMSELGYKRSAKRCKEKWENINKYFRKTKDVNKKRSLDSRTCPYFHQLTSLYSQGKLASQSQSPGNHFNPIPNSVQVPPDQPQQSSVFSSGLIKNAC